MTAYLRLLRFLRPYTAQLVVALACMAFYAAMNFASLGMISPLMSVLFDPARNTATASANPAPAATVGLPWARAGADPRADRLPGWPEPLKGWASRTLVHARPLVALERICLLFLLVFFLKNLADYLQSFPIAAG